MIPASAAIFEALEDHLRGLAAYIRNTEDVISYYRTKEGFITIIIDTLQRIRELVIQMSGIIIGPFEQQSIEKLNAENFKSTGDTDYSSEISRLKRNQIIFFKK